MSLTPAKIEAAAAAALGGPAVRPPALATQPIGKVTKVPTGDAEARAAFTARHLPPAVPVTNNPTFDAPPPELVERAAKVRLARERLASVIGTIERERAALLPALDALLPEERNQKRLDFITRHLLRSLRKRSKLKHLKA